METAGADEQYLMSEAHDSGEEPLLTGVRFVCAQEVHRESSR
jgi:hypothetical protein